MTRTEKLISKMAEANKHGKGIFSRAELAYLLQVDPSPSFNKFLHDCTKKKVIHRVTKGLYESAVTPPNPRLAIYEIASKLRVGYLSYISLESQLSYTGDISQIIIGRLTVMTRGRKGLFKTKYGVIEFTHTKNKVASIEDDLYFDDEVKMFRAKTERAFKDLYATKRNLQMIIE